MATVFSVALHIRGNQIHCYTQDPLLLKNIQTVLDTCRLYIQQNEVVDFEVLKSIVGQYSLQLQSQKSRTTKSKTSKGKIPKGKIPKDKILEVETLENLKHSIETHVIKIPISGRTIYPKSEGQKKIIDSLMKYDLTLLAGPAGTGKTYLPAAYAMAELLKKQYERIVITRPVVESGEHLGFLPGDLEQKITPYIRPIQDAFNEFVGAQLLKQCTNAGKIDISPLAYMRGRTLTNSFVILDEAQNATPGQMKMFLTRIGEQSKVVVSGDLTQSDQHSKNGFSHVLKILKNTSSIHVVYLKEQDIQRSRLVKDIVKSYYRYEQ